MRIKSLAVICSWILASAAMAGDYEIALTVEESLLPGDAVDLAQSVVAAVGDVDHDGVGDILLGAPRFDVIPTANEGALFVLSGADGSVIHMIIGTYIGENLGGYLNSGKPFDLNNDGYPDLAAWSSGGFTSATTAAVNIYSGLDASVLQTFQAPAPLPSGVGFGESILVIDDVDGDGTVDIAIGAPFAGSNNSGAAFVFSGGSGALLYQVSMPVLANQPDQFGFALAPLDDHTADGIAEFAVSTRGGTANKSAAVCVIDPTVNSILHTMVGVGGRLVAGQAIGSEHRDIYVGSIKQPIVQLYDVFAGAQSPAHTITMSSIALSMSSLDADDDGDDDLLVRNKSGNKVVLHSIEGTAHSSTEYGTGHSVAWYDNQTVAGISRPAFAVASTAQTTLWERTSLYQTTHQGCSGPIDYAAPVLQWVGPTTAGSLMTLQVSNGVGQGTVVLLAGPNEANIPIGSGCHLHVGPPMWIGSFPLSGTSLIDGSTTIFGMIPPISADTELFIQGVILHADGTAMNTTNTLKVLLEAN